MPRAFTPAQHQQWTAVYRETLALAEFIDSTRPFELLPAPGEPGERPSLAFADHIRREAEPRAPFAARLAGLREARNDLLEMCDDLSGAQLRELDGHLQRAIGVGLDALQSKRLARLDALRAKGALSTDEQFRLVYGRLEQIWDDQVRQGEARELQALMAGYERLVERRLARRRGSSQG